MHTAYSYTTGKLVTASGTLYSTGPSTPQGQRPSEPIVRDPLIGSSVLAFWGADNLLPQHVIDEVKRNSLIGSTLSWKASALYGGGITYGIQSIENGLESFRQIADAEINQFLKVNRRYLLEAARDLYYFANVFPEVILNKARTHAVALTCQEAAFARWGRQNDRGFIDTCYLSANWDQGDAHDSEDTLKVRVLNPYLDPVEQVRNGTGHKFIYPISYPSPGRTYYQMADWNAIRLSGWLEVANAIPEFKRFLMKNQISLRYHVQVPEYWWRWKYPEWETGMTPDDRRARIQEEAERFDDFLAGKENAGKSLMTTFRFDEGIQREYPGWKIEPIGGNRAEGGDYLADSQEASAHLLFALGVDSTLIGSAPGTTASNGGTNKREAFNMYLSMCTAHEELIMEPLHFIADYNGWSARHPGLHFRFRRPHLQMLADVTPAQRETLE